MEIQVTLAWKMAYPGAAIGILILNNVFISAHHSDLEKKRVELEAKLRAQYSGFNRQDLERIPEIQAYKKYYRRFEKTYHVLLQLESILFHQKSIPIIDAIVQAMFMAEMENLLLTAGHDLHYILEPTGIDIASGTEKYTVLRGDEKTCKHNDMVMVDSQGVICSVIYGSDYRTRIRQETHEVLFVVYCPPGIEVYKISDHLRTIAANINLASPQSTIATEQILIAD